MADPHFVEDDQAARLKAWWKQNGSSVVIGAVIGIGIVVGVNWWRTYERQVAENASALYETILRSMSDDQAAAREAARKLQADFAQTAYAVNAALLLSRIQYDQGDAAAARASLNWALEHSADPATQHVARLRLARLLLEEGEWAAVERLVEVPDPGGFESEYRELNGDLAMARGKAADAQAAYRAALEALPAGSSYAPMLNMKLDRAIAEAAR